MTETTTRIAITGGGTGGHVSPAVAVIEALRERLPGDELQLLYLGSRGGTEARVIPVMGVPYRAVSTGKLRRYMSLENLTDMPRIPLGVVQSLAYLSRFNPHVVFATGGYVSVPAVIAAATIRRPVLVHEPTGTIGLANKINARFATVMALSVPGTERWIPGRKWVLTGNPVRGVVRKGDKTTAARRFRFDPKFPTVYVTGGAHGSHKLNETVREALPRLLEIAQVIHQCGDSPGTHDDYEGLARSVGELPASLQPRYALQRYIGAEIGEVYALSDLVIGRAGASTVTELTALGKPAIFVPLPRAAGDEQRINAQRAVEAGGAIIIEEEELTAERLVSEVSSLVSDHPRLEAMARASKAAGFGDAAGHLADLLLKLARTRQGSR